MDEMQLPRGITGFWKQGETPLPVMDWREFKRHCYEAMRQAGGEVRSFADPSRNVYLRNYTVAVVTMPDSLSLAVICHQHFPWVAFTQVPADGEVVLRFQDCPSLSTLFAKLGNYRILTLAELEQPVSAFRLE